MTSRRRIGLAAGLVLGMLSVAAITAPASAAWWGNGQWHQDTRWNDNRNYDNRNYDRRYYGYHYRDPPVVYSTPYNYGYQPPPVIYDQTPGFTIRLQ
jgi:hypothetical protein